MNSRSRFDAIIVGGGHAGIEAALSISRAGYEVLLMTMDRKAIGRMSCNPAIGGLAKGHMVREIDALGGEMARAIDATGIQFRMLNRSRGPAVWAPRAQADKEQYSLYMQRALAAEKNLVVHEGQAVEILIENEFACGIRTQQDEIFHARVVILTTGTFLQGLIHIGQMNFPGGRRDEPPAVGLSDSLRRSGIELIRFKTGTPPRLHADEINWNILEEQKGDEPPEPFSFRTGTLKVDQISCYLTYTHAESHRLIRENLHRSPLYAGRITGTGPRYCPSIEDKIVKFADKERHQIYLEPEGRNTKEVYVNGLSTSLPEDVQQAVIQTIPGCENAKLLRKGYAIEYDCAPPTQLQHTLETKKIGNLYLAGQINCTSGYEEAAAQGLMAGLNAIRKFREQPPLILDRTEAYIGVLIDDLVTRGTPEPYRMFTSRAEFRLLLRQDNADERLMKYGVEMGLFPKEIYDALCSSHARIRHEIQRLRGIRHQHTTLDKWLRRPEIRYEDLAQFQPLPAGLEQPEIRKVEIEIKYEGYISRQWLEVQKFRKMEKRQIPDTVDFALVPGISREAREKLTKIRPVSIGQASRIPGISSCDLSLLAVHLERMSRSTRN